MAKEKIEKESEEYLKENKKFDLFISLLGAFIIFFSIYCLFFYKSFYLGISFLILGDIVFIIGINRFIKTSKKIKEKKK